MLNRKKILVICGPTATGKTSLALRLSKLLEGEIVSSDSRQIYRGMNVGTGKNLPKNLKTKKNKNLNTPFYEIEGVRTWGYDIADPSEDFSISHYLEIANKIIEYIWRKGKLPVIVGGTGFYIKGIVDGIPTADIPQNKKLRKELENKSVNELFKLLAKDDPQKANSMNSSDSKNPRRLVRAIEIARSNSLPLNSASRLIPKASILQIGLTAPKEVLAIRIKNSIKKRLYDGVLDEIKNLIRSGVTWEMQSMNTLGYKEWKQYFEGLASEDESLERWVLDEIQYSKRQMTWFKKDSRINWFDISLPDWDKKLENLVSKWYSE